MIFGIKTKKDKKIEELQAEIDRLNNITIKPIIRYEQYETEDYYSVFEIHFEDVERITEDEILNILCKQMCDALKQNIEIMCEDDYVRRIKIFRGRIKVLRNK